MKRLPSLDGMLDHRRVTKKKILKILRKFENLKIQCKQQHELNKTLLLLPSELAVPKFSRKLGRVSDFNKSINWYHHMKDHVEIDSLTKYMMLWEWTETKLWTLKYGSKSIQTSLILRQRHPKPYKLLKCLWFPWYSLKMGKHSNFHRGFFQIAGAWGDFTVVTKLMKNFKSL